MEGGGAHVTRIVSGPMLVNFKSVGAGIAGVKGKGEPHQ